MFREKDSFDLHKSNTAISLMSVCVKCNEKGNWVSVLRLGKSHIYKNLGCVFDQETSVCLHVR